MARNSGEVEAPLPLGEPRDEVYPAAGRKCPVCYRENTLNGTPLEGLTLDCSGCGTEFRVEAQLFGTALRRLFCTYEPRRCVDCGTRCGSSERCTPCYTALASDRRAA